MLTQTHCTAIMHLSNSQEKICIQFINDMKRFEWSMIHNIIIMKAALDKW